jgi:hypothetical protein
VHLYRCIYCSQKASTYTNEDLGYLFSSYIDTKCTTLSQLCKCNCLILGLDLETIAEDVSCSNTNDVAYCHKSCVIYSNDKLEHFSFNINLSIINLNCQIIVYIIFTLSSISKRNAEGRIMNLLSRAATLHVQITTQ